MRGLLRQVRDPSRVEGEPREREQPGERGHDAARIDPWPHAMHTQQQQGGECDRERDQAVAAAGLANSAPPAIVLIDAPLKGSNASHSRSVRPAICGAPIGFADTPSKRNGSAQRSADGKRNALDAAEPGRIAREDHRPQAAGLHGDGRKVGAARRNVALPEHLHVGAVRHALGTSRRLPGTRCCAGR